jgi:hypothetical protein
MVLSIEPGTQLAVLGRNLLLQAAVGLGKTGEVLLQPGAPHRHRLHPPLHRLQTLALLAQLVRVNHEAVVQVTLQLIRQFLREKKEGILK